MKQQELADALGVNQSQISRYTRRGMPLDVAGAKAWMREHVNMTMHAPAWRRQAKAKPRQAEPEVDPDRALDGVELLGIAGATLLRAGQSLGAMEPLIRDALRAVPHDHRDRIVFVGTEAEFRSAFENRLPADDGDGDCPFPIIVWSALVADVVAAGRQADDEMIAAGELLPRDLRPAMSDDEAEDMADFWYAVAAGELVAK